MSDDIKVGDIVGWTESREVLRQAPYHGRGVVVDVAPYSHGTYVTIRNKYNQYFSRNANQVTRFTDEVPA